MAFWNKKVDISESKNCGEAQIQKEELTPEQLKELEKKNAKLIDIYKCLDGDKSSLSNIDLALAMDGFVAADVDGDGKLSNKELNDFAKAFNKQFELDGDKALKGKDFKNFLKSYQSVTKGNEKVSANEYVYDSEVAKYAAEQDWKLVEGQKYVYQDADGRVFMPSPNDKNFIVQAKYDEESKTYVPMTDEQIKAQDKDIAMKKYLAKADAAAEEQEFSKTEHDGIYRAKDGLLYWGKEDDGGNLTFKPVKDAGNEYVEMTESEVAAQKGGYEEVSDGVYKKDGKTFVYQDGTFKQAHKSGDKTVVMSDKAVENSNPSSYTIQLGESYDDLIKRSLKGQHAGEEGYVPTKEEIAAAKAEFEANNKGAVGGKGSKKYLIAGKKVKIAGGLVDKNNATEVNAKYGAAVEKRQAEKQKAMIDDAATKKGFDKTNSDKFYVDRKTGTHYKWNAQKNDFVEAKGVYFVGKDGSYKTREESKINSGFYNLTEYDAAGNVKSKKVRSEDGKTTLKNHAQAAKSLGLRETLASQSQGVYYDEATKTHYRYDEKKQSFIPESGYEMIGRNGGTFDKKGQQGDFQLKKDGTEVKKYEDGSYRKTTFDPKTGNMTKREYYSASGELEKTKTYQYDKQGRYSVVNTYDAEGKFDYFHLFEYKDDGTYVEKAYKANGSCTDEWYCDSNGNAKKSIHREFELFKTEVYQKTYGKGGSYVKQSLNKLNYPTGELEYYDKDGNKIDKAAYDELQK